jgi:hypothetical protein
MRGDYHRLRGQATAYKRYCLVVRRPGRPNRRHKPLRANTLSSPASPLSWGGFDGLDASNNYTASGPVIPGAATGFHVQFWAWFETTAVSATRTFVCTNGTGGAAGGWLFVTRTTNATLEFAAVDGSQTTRFTPAYTLQPGDYGRPVHVCGWRDATHIRLAVDGVEVGTGLAVTGHTAGSGVLTVGARPAASQSAGGLIRLLGGLSGGAVIPSAGDISAAYSAGLAAKDISPIAGATDTWSWTALGSAAASISPSAGVDSLTRVGTPTWVTA